MSEVHYLTYDADEIYIEMQKAYMEAGGDVLYPGDEKEMLLRSVQAILVQAFAGVDNALRMATLRYAVGEYLDLYGEKRGCERIRAHKAQTIVNMMFTASGIQKVIPAGTKLTNDGTSIWELKNDVAQSGQTQTVKVMIEATEAGSAGNSLKTGMPMQFCSPQSGVSAIFAAEDAKGGNDEETDENYRERIRQYGLTSVTTGTSDAYESAAMDVSSRIVDAKAVNTGDGEVTVYLITEDGADAESIYDAVEERLNDRSARPLTDKLTVTGAADVPYTLNVLIESDINSGIGAAAAQAAAEYQAWQDDTIGNAFNPDRLMAALYNAGATRVQWGSGSAFNGGAVQYTEILNSQRCKGVITLTEQ